MTANFIAQVVENYYNKLDLDNITVQWKDIEQYSDCGRVSDKWVNREIKDPTYFRWLEACYVLETYLKKNYNTFHDTELVRKWASDICKQRNHDLNQWRAYGAYVSFSNFLKKKY